MKLWSRESLKRARVGHGHSLPGSGQGPGAHQEVQLVGAETEPGITGWGGVWRSR